MEKGKGKREKGRGGEGVLQLGSQTDGYPDFAGLGTVLSNSKRRRQGKVERGFWRGRPKRVAAIPGPEMPWYSPFVWSKNSAPIP
jgi:hypothetical protein